MEKYDPSQLRDVSVPLEQIATRGLLLSVVLLLLGALPHILIWGFDSTFHGADYLLGFIATIILLVLHEATHALGWIIFAGVSPASIRFGIMWKTLSPYAHSRVAMPAGGYRIGVILPAILTGILPTLIGTITNTGWLTAAGAVLLSGAVGDLIVLQIIRAIPANAQVLDHPTNASCYVVVESESSSPDHQF